MKDLIEEFEKDTGWKIRGDEVVNPMGFRTRNRDGKYHDLNRAEAYKALSEWLAKKLEEAREEVEKQKVHVKQTIENAKEADAIWRQELERVKGGFEMLLDFAKSLEDKAYDAWKPVQCFRSDSEVEVDEIKREVLEAIWDEIKPTVEELTKTQEG